MGVFVTIKLFDLGQAPGRTPLKSRVCTTGRVKAGPLMGEMVTCMRTSTAARPR